MDFDVPEVDGRAGVLALEADPPSRSQLRLGPAQPGRDFAAVGVGLGRRPQAHVHVRDLLAVELDRDPLSGAGDGIVVPFPGRLDRAFRRGQVAEDGAAVPGGRLLGPLLGEIVGDLDLDRVGDPVGHIRAIDDDAAVRPRRGHEFQVQDEVLVVLLGPERLVLRGGDDAVRNRPNAGLELGVREVGGEQRGPGGLGRGGSRRRRRLGFLASRRPSRREGDQQNGNEEGSCAHGRYSFSGASSFDSVDPLYQDSGPREIGTTPTVSSGARTPRTCPLPAGFPLANPAAPYYSGAE